jgi:hypothetical protein
VWRGEIVRDSDEGARKKPGASAGRGGVGGDDPSSVEHAIACEGLELG